MAKRRRQSERNVRPGEQTPPRPAPLSGAQDATPSPARKWGFRVLAVTLVPLVLLICLELAFRIIGIGYPTAYFIKAPAAYGNQEIDNQRFSRRFFPPTLVRCPQPCVLPVVKPARTCRIFVFGESAALGDPDPGFSFSRVFEALLKDRDPGVKFEVINTSITAINSHVILPIAQDAAKQSGDMWVIYMGNNEVVGPYGAGTVFGPQAPSLALIRSALALKATRVGQAVSALAQTLGAHGKEQTWGGMTMFLDQQIRQDDPRMARVYNYFQKNLRSMVQLGTKAGAKVLLCTVGSNLKDCAPFASLHRPGLSDADKKSWEQEFATGVALQSATNFVGALDHYQLAAKTDDRYADLAYRMGRCFWALGRYAEARQCFTRARDEDALRFRADTRINRLIRDAAGTSQVSMVDAENVLAEHSPNGIPGDELFFEHVHLRFEGNYWLGRAVAEQITKVLPPDLAGTNVSAKPWLSADECANRLARSDWDRYQSVEIMLKRMKEPPFSNQSDAASRVQRWDEHLAQLRPHTKPYALKRTVEFYERQVALSPNDWVLHSNFGRLWEGVGDTPAALAQYQESLRLMPHNPLVHFAMARLLDTSGKSTEAEARFRTAVDMRPDFYEAWNGLGLCLVHQRNYPEAVKCFKQALRLEPDNPQAKKSLETAAAMQQKGEP